MATNAPTASRHQHDLPPAPIILVRHAIIEHARRVPATQPADEANVEQSAHALEGYMVQNGEILAALGQAREEEQRAGEEGVEGGGGDEPHDTIRVEPFAGEKAVVHWHCGGCCIPNERPMFGCLGSWVLDALLVV